MKKKNPDPNPHKIRIRIYRYQCGSETLPGFRTALVSKLLIIVTKEYSSGIKYCMNQMLPESNVSAPITT
jgi:hypothetical protein